MNSLLFKTALFGEDPNWGRIAAAAGSSGVNFNPNRIDIYLGAKKVLKDGGLFLLHTIGGNKSVKYT